MNLPSYSFHFSIQENKRIKLGGIYGRILTACI
jgi:hypothetical protein